jgi:hypothetical protein
LPSCLASSSNPTLARMIFCSCVIVVSVTPDGRAAVPAVVRTAPRPPAPASGNQLRLSG